MKKLLNFLGVTGVIITAALMPGCGGGGDNNDNGTPVQTAFAPSSLANRTVTLTENGTSRNVSFATSGNSFTQFQTGTTNAVGTGTFQYSQQGNNGGQLVLSTTDQNGATNQVTYNLTFTSAS